MCIRDREVIGPIGPVGAGRVGARVGGLANSSPRFRLGACRVQASAARARVIISAFMV